MKRFKLFVISMLFLTGCILSYCSGITNPTPDEVMSKINSGQTLDEDDYATMIDYIQEFCAEGESSDGSYESGRAAGEKYPYFMAFGMTLGHALDNNSDQIKDKEVATKTMQRLMNALGR